MKSYKLSYNEPAELDHVGWKTRSLPIGNSRKGMCIFGHTNVERLQFNEKTLWAGGPSKKRPDYNGGNIEGSYEYLEKIRKALDSGKYSEVLTLKDKLIGKEEGYGNYLNFGDLVIDSFSAICEDYSRELDLNTAIAYVKYKTADNEYKRSHFASYPDDVIVVKLESKNKASYNVSINAARNASYNIVGNKIYAVGKVEDNDLEFCAIAAIKTDGDYKKENNSIKIDNSTYVEIYLDAGTNYKNEYPKYRGESPQGKVEANIDRVLEKDYETILTSHIEDYQKLFNRFSLNLEEKEISCTTNELIKEVSIDDRKEKQFVELLYQYGRYLLISSSRGNDLPANLQGVWNDSNSPMWGSDYHLNINLQMCYWHIYASNLTECSLPMINYMNSLRAPGRVTAECYHNIASDDKNKENGWVCHTQNTPFGWTCPGWDFYWGWSPAASSWMMQNCFDYYEYTLDTEFLKNSIYPMLKENIVFWMQNLIWDEKQQRYVSSPTFSPEQGPITIGNSYEQTLLAELFKMGIKAATVLKDDEEFIEKMKKISNKLDPIGIGKWGQVKEWREEDSWIKIPMLKRLFYMSKRVYHGHRHVSHLLGLYPYNSITRKDKDLFKAAKVSLLDRGEGIGPNGPAWSKVNKTCLWARLKDSKHAYVQLRSMMKTNVLDNLWAMHPIGKNDSVFQMDGNAGFCAAVNEMLVYDNDDYIEILPAMPQEWENGSVEGYCIKGGHEIGFTWKDGKVTSLKVSGRSNKVKLYINEATRDIAKGSHIGDIIEFESK